MLTSLLFLCKPSCCTANEFSIYNKKSSEVCIIARSTPASFLLKGLVTEHRSVKWSNEQIECGLAWSVLIDNDMRHQSGQNVAESRRECETTFDLFFITIST